jgi:glycosyltransferase involved in cell wall biosynthesis
VKNPIISIVIPCFNSEKYIESTLQSILNQSEKNFEILIINDGSTDNSLKIINQFKDKRINIISQENQGVSAARNYGLKLAKGKFIVFFDSDDVMSKDFLILRLNFLKNNNIISFCSGIVISYPLKNKIFETPYEDIKNKILLDNKHINTCPSNYMFKIQELKATKVLFSNQLSNAADRLFLLEISNFLKGGFIGKKGSLLYRIHQNSMSRKVNPKLISDNLLYLNLVINNNLVPKEIKNSFLTTTHYTISGLCYANKFYFKAIYHSLVSLYLNPIKFSKQILKLHVL